MNRPAEGSVRLRRDRLGCIQDEEGRRRSKRWRRRPKRCWPTAGWLLFLKVTQAKAT